MNQTTQTLTYLRPEHLARIRNLHLWAKHIVEGMNVGVHRSPYHGFSAEFAEYRPYQPGESTRMIDWRKYAKSDATVVRLFEDETNLFAHLLLDTSASMAFHSPQYASKYAFASILSTSLAWILVRQRDAVGFAAFNESVRVLLSPRSTNVQLRTIIGQIDRLTPTGGTRCGAAMDALAARLRKRGLCVVVSDLLDTVDDIKHGLRHLRFKRQDVIVLWVRDPLEMAFAHDAPLRLRDMESGEQLHLDPRIAAEHYNANMAQHALEIESVCRDLQVDLVTVGTDEPFEKVLSRIMQKRKRLY
ncbi:MAG: DUF58 domain-containing protein [Chitinivibrionales bacterium]|nr:DUF58 domain-containing protein [Chitinivibrionales bacterium]